LALKRLSIACRAALCAAIVLCVPGTIAATGDSRAISLYNIHTKEMLAVVYKRNGKYVPEAMKRIDWAMRDWRRNETIEIDPALIDLIWEVHAELQSKEPVHIICGYRSRGTNEMLRKTVGGQASQSRHILGKAADVHFPDIPLRQLRYSALLRERGGVGYYPTSAIPFVHLDTDRVRHWPRLPRYEMALLFPSRASPHLAGTGPVTPDEARAAREQHADVAADVANVLALAHRPAPFAVAGRDGVPVPRPVPAKPPAGRMALAAAPPPALAAAPRLVERPSRLTPGPSAADRGKLDQLVARALSSGGARPPEFIGPPAPAAAAPAAAALDAAVRVAALAPDPSLAATREEVWEAAPAYDEEHPGELSYRPFPVAPFLTASSSPDDPVLAVLTPPDLGRALDMIGDEGAVPPLRFRPGQPAARLLWAQHFQGKAIRFGGLEDPSGAPRPPDGVVPRGVTTQPRRPLRTRVSRRARGISRPPARRDAPVP